MRSYLSSVRCVCLLLLFGSFVALPGSAQEPECDDPPPANGPIDPTLLTYCVTNPGTNCDLGITAWDLITHRSPDLRIGDRFDSPDPERPRFFFSTPGNQFYTKLYSRFQSLGGGPAPASEVTVTFSFKETSDPADVDNAAIPWQAIGTYAMNIPPPPEGVLFPSDTHAQQKGLCWHRPPGVQFPLQFILRAQIAWPAGPDGTSDNDTAYSFYDLTGSEPLAQIALALDLSGSMTETLPSGPTKLVEAKEKAQLFTNLVEDGNQLGVYGFATGNPANTPFTATYTGTDSLAHTETMGDTSQVAAIHTIAGNLDRALTGFAISLQDAHGCTPVGPGLLRARAGLASLAPPPGASKAIVLFSDGLQNVRPYVNTPASFSCGGPPAAVDISAAATFGSENIKIYSIYFGSEMGWGFDLMNQVKEQTGGDYVYGVPDSLGLAAAYYSIRGLVDDMIFFEDDGTTSSSDPWPTFEAHFDAAAKVATVAVAWELGDGKTRLAVDYRRKGDHDWKTAEPLSGQGRPGGADSASFLVFRFTPGANTTWELRVRQTAPAGATAAPATRFTAAVFSVVQSLQLRPSLGDSGFETGRPLPIHAELRSGGHPAVGATVDAMVRVPSRSFSTTLRKYRKQLDRKSSPDAGPVPAMAAHLRSLLAQNEGSGELYLYRDVTVHLRDDGQGADRTAGDGLYSGELPDSETHIAGDYEVTITAQAVLPGGRPVTRTARLETICNVGPADPRQSVVEIDLPPSRDEVDDDSRVATITILPTDRFGNAAFPGSGRQIGITAQGGRLQGSLTDNLDASFTQELVVGPGEEAEVTVTVSGVSLGRHAVGGVDRRHELSLHLGTAMPHGAFATQADAGLTGSLDFVHRFDSHLAVRAELGLSRFEGAGGSNLDLVNLNAYLQYRWGGSLWVPYFETGLGFYDLRSGSSGPGFATGLGAQYLLSPNVNLDLAIHGHHVGGGLGIDYSQIRAGVLFKF